MCGIHDRLIFSEAGLTEEHRSQEWKTISPEQQPAEYIFIIDLGGHFVYAEPFKQTKSLPSNSATSPDSLFSDPLFKDKLKKTLESLGDDELLSKEKVKEAEKAYTLALHIAVQEKDTTQESIYIERLGDVYLRKGTSKTLLQAAGLYQYVLRLSSEDRQEIIKEKIFNIQDLLTTLCEGKLLSHEVMRKQFEDNSKALKKFREKIEEKIQVLPETPSSEKVRTLYAEIAQQIKIFFKFLAMQAIETLGPAPCEYAMIGFGSLAREEMTPYSDLEFGILIQDDTSSNKKYFKHLTTLLHLKIINLGETILPALNIPCLKAIDFFDGITPRGLAFDGAGVEGKGCKTPFGNGKTFELIQTPEKMAQYVGKDEKGQWWHEKEPHLPMELLNHTHLLGNGELTKCYDEKIREVLDMTYQESLDLRHYLAKEHLVLADMETFNPGMGDLNKHGMLFRIKNDFYRFPHLAIDRLALLKEVVASDTFGRVDQLNKKGILTNKAAEKLQEWMSIALFMRLKTYSHYQAQQEMMNPLIKPFGFNYPNLIKKQFALNHDALEKIKKIYGIFISFYQAMEKFLAGNEDPLKFSDLEDNSPKTQGDILLRLFQYKKAEKCYLLANEINPQDSEVLSTLGIIYRQQGNLDKAAEYCDKALALNLNLYDENDPRMASCYANVGQTYKEQGNLDKAAEYYNKALALDLNLYGENNPQVASCHANIAQIYKEQGNLDKAAEYCNKALAVHLSFFGKNHLSVAIYYSNLGGIYEEQGKLDEAVEYSNKALALDIKLYSKYHPMVAIDYNNLAHFYQAQGNLGKAAEYCNKALIITLKLYGKYHPTVAACYGNLGQIYQDQGNLDKAADYTNKALAINLKLFGENHPNVAIYYSNLGQIYQEQGNLDKAVEHGQIALKIAVKLFAENHPTVARNYNNLGLTYCMQGNIEKAIEYCNRALLIDIRLFGKNHHYVARECINLGAFYRQQGNLDVALKYVHMALKINLRLFGENNLMVSCCYANLGQIYQEQGNLDKAAECNNKALAINLKLFGENHPKVAIDYGTRGSIYQEQGNLDKAAECNNKALAINRKLFGEKHPSVAGDYDSLGAIYQDQGNLAKAAEYRNKALTINLKLYGENHPD
ncbi:hypothetical protein DB41_DZ00010, partial [Neochlamydia sp. TUME1]|uniref:tetratricopeptide repeat protein n=1 Tax=Neochlamydia sp. TUME1 TaxID=1478174 RepID=UPI00057D69D1